MLSRVTAISITSNHLSSLCVGNILEPLCYSEIQINVSPSLVIRTCKAEAAHQNLTHWKLLILTFFWTGDWRMCIKEIPAFPKLFLAPELGSLYPD